MYIKEEVKANKDFTRQEHDDIPWEVKTNHRGLGAIILEKILQKMWIMEASGRAQSNYAGRKWASFRRT
jgi:hypothetical protein